MISRPAWAEIDLSALAHNYREIRRITAPEARVMAVVKANAYGHGAVPVSQVVLANGADCLGVAIINEARQLREAGIEAPILVLGYTPEEQVEEIIQLDVTQTVFDTKTAEAISRAAVKHRKKAKIHVKVDTGLGRLGFLPSLGLPEEVVRIARMPGIDIEGIFTHFSVAGAKDKEYTYQQYEEFLRFDKALRNLGLEIPLKHTANSAAIIDLPGVHMNMVRAGITLYGLYPSEEVFRERVKLRSVLSLKARIAQVKTVPAGTSISYGRMHITQKESRIATIPLGYADGYLRLFTHKSSVLIKGQRAPQIGTICMDQFMVDVSKIPEAGEGDEVVLIGRQGQQEISADELANLMGTINYEIVCMLGGRIPRVYVNK